MQVREMLELAGLVSTHGPLLVARPVSLPLEPLERYWTASKCRLDRWGRALRQHAADGVSVRPTIEEILLNEVLTRVWAALLCAHDRRTGRSDAEPIARSVLIGHLEARNRALLRILHGPGISAEEALALNRLRRRAEHWTNLLVAQLAADHDLSEFAIDPSRARELAQQLHSAEPSSPTVLLAMLRAAFHDLPSDSPNADLNAPIAESILACFGAEHFDSTGLFRSLWLMRLASVPTDTQGMIDQLLASEAPATPVDRPPLDAAFLLRRRLP